MNNLLEKHLKCTRNHLNDDDECFLLRSYVYNGNNKVTYSIIIPVYNQEQIIVKNIKSILEYTLGSFELIVILDFCDDNSEENITTFFDTYNNKNSNFYGVRIFKQPNSPVFEASCDNIGFVNSFGDFCLEIQADMEMQEIGYNLQLSKPFALLDNVFAVSGRCAHNLFDRFDGIGKLGVNIEKTVEEMRINKNTFYVYDTCNRGPILFSKSKLEKVNFLNEKKFYQDNSDHDAIVRSNLSEKSISGYVPINFLAPLHDGSTRKKTFNHINSKYKRLRERQCRIENTLDAYSLGKVFLLKKLAYYLSDFFVMWFLTNRLKKPKGWITKKMVTYDITSIKGIW